MSMNSEQFRKLLERTIREEVKNVINEDTRKWTIKDITYDDIQQMSVRVTLPNQPGGWLEINKEYNFDDWKKHFTRHYGTDGNIVLIGKDRFEIQGNHKWDKANKDMANSMGSYYGKGNGNYTGD